MNRDDQDLSTPEAFNEVLGRTRAQDLSWPGDFRLTEARLVAEHRLERTHRDVEIIPECAAHGRPGGAADSDRHVIGRHLGVGRRLRWPTLAAASRASP